MKYSAGATVKATTTIHRSAGSAWPGDTGRIVRITGDGYVIRWDKGGWVSEVVKDGEVESA